MNHRRHNSVLGHVLIALAIFLVVCAVFAGGYGIDAFIYQFTGQPPEILRHVLSGLTAILIILALSLVFKLIGSSRWQGNGFDRLRGQLTDALAQIAQGNFNILLDPDTTGPYDDVAQAINDMAKSLGTLEAMRQDFITNVSHEIQSPLTSISGFAALLQKDGLPDEERRRYAAIIEAESRRMSSLSDNLLKLSSLDDNKIPLAKKDFRLDKQLEHVALMLEPQWTAKGLALEADLQKLTVCGDEDLLSQVWVNLLHNAIKFTPEGGRIEVSLAAKGESAVVKVSDTGVGIAAEDQMHIFERFYKADRARDRSLGGNGLGLSLVKRIIELHGGTITVESEVGKGTTFTLALPTA